MNMWPWSYNKCGDIANLDSKQEVNACDSNPGNGMHPFQGTFLDLLRSFGWVYVFTYIFCKPLPCCNVYLTELHHHHQGRGAPEIDLLEVMPGHEMGGGDVIKAFVSSSLQVLLPFYI
jgi:hypothetical protein